MIRVLQCTPLLVTSFVIISVFVFKIGDLISLDYEHMTENDFGGAGPSSGVTGNGTQQHRRVSRDSDEDQHDTSLRLDDTSRHLVWFLQISDLHISQFSNPQRVDQLKEFCRKTVPVIAPSVVLASGDLTDGKTRDMFGSKQSEEEWKMYKEVLQSAGILTKTIWLDIRGNHDNFDVSSINSSTNYYRRYSMQGHNHPKSYMYQLVNGYDKYSFIAVDACLEPGPRRPFNFIGLLTESEMKALSELESMSSETSNATVWFGHYPTSSVLSPQPGLRHLMSNGLAYLCGHFHTLGGWAPRMYSLQKTGLLELELGDWKDSRVFRVAAIDHGIFSFVDVKHSEWPVVLLTNPKHALFALPGKEPLHRVNHSTHIRILVFSVSAISKVFVQIDGGHWEQCRHADGPLYLLAWKPQLYGSGLHEISVKAQDEAGRERTVTQPFSLDGSRTTFELLPRIILMSSLTVSAQVLLGLSLCVAVLPLCWIRLMHHYERAGKLPRPRYRWRLTYSLMRKLWLLATVDRIFYPVVILAIYVPLGPWFVGRIIEDHVGVCFAWGMYVNGSYLPGGFTFVFAVIHLWTFNIPLALLLSLDLDYRYRHSMESSPPVSSFLSYVIRNLPVFLLLLFNCYVAYLVMLTYGSMAFLLGPLKTWSIPLGLLLWQVTVRTPKRSLAHLYPVFPIKRKIPFSASSSSVDPSLTIPLRTRSKSDD